jgi:polyisoprenoid-binding protein YceI
MNQRLAVNVCGACFLFLLLMRPSPARGDSRTIDPESSTITVRVFKSGLFSFMAHDHEIRANGLKGQAEIGDHPSVSFQISASRLKVIDPAVTEKDRAEIQQTMEGAKVLNVNAYPEIQFQSTAVQRQTSERWQVAGNLILRGKARAISFTVQQSGNRYQGKTTLRQKDFGIEPISIAGGAVRVKDEVEIEFDVLFAPTP